MPPLTDVAIIGGGLVGVSTAAACCGALHGVAKKANIALFERAPSIVHDQGSSHGASRIIRRTYPTHHHAEMMKPAFDLWESVRRRTGAELVTLTGGVDMAKLGNPFLDGIVQANDALGVEYVEGTLRCCCCACCCAYCWAALLLRPPCCGPPTCCCCCCCRCCCLLLLTSLRYELLDPGQLAAKYRGMAMPDGWQAVSSPEAGVLNPDLARATLADLCLEAEVSVHAGAAVVRLDPGDAGVTIHLEDGTRTYARRVVVAAGAHTRALLRDSVGIDIPLRLKEMTPAYWDLAGSGSADNLPVLIDYEHNVYGMPCRKHPGHYKLAFHEADFVPGDDPSGRTYLPDEAALRASAKRVAAFFPEAVSEAPGFTESCVYTMTPDEDFIMDTVPGTNGNVIVGSCCSGHGAKMSNINGSILAGLALQEDLLGLDLDLAPFSLAREGITDPLSVTAPWGTHAVDRLVL